jgi:LPS sulfotransferase NodH
MQEELRFCNLVRNVEVDAAAFAIEMLTTVPADRNYIIVFTPRSGSSWLTSILSATGQLGRPEEYLNPNFVADVVRSTNAREPDQLIKLLRRRRKTPNGVFGIEVRALDVMLFGEPEFFAEFGPDTVIFCLWRDNIVAQGISLYRAVASRRFHSYEAPAAPPDYAADQIEHWIRHVLQIENGNLAMLQRRGLPARFLRYEDLVRNRAVTLALFAEPLNVSLLPDVLQARAPGELGKIADEWNRVAEQRFRQEAAEFVAGIEQQRRVRR